MSITQIFPCNNSYPSTVPLSTIPSTMLQNNLQMKSFEDVKIEAPKEVPPPGLPYLDMILQSVLVGNQMIPMRLKVLLHHVSDYFNGQDLAKSLAKCNWAMEEFQQGFVNVSCEFTIYKNFFLKRRKFSTIEFLKFL